MVGRLVGHNQHSFAVVLAASSKRAVAAVHIDWAWKGRRFLSADARKIFNWR